MEDRRSLALKNGFEIVKILVGLAIVGVLCLAAYLGYKKYTEEYAPTANENGEVVAKVVVATLFKRSDLRVGHVSGTVQGVGNDSRFWGWLNSSQVVKAPFNVNYFISMDGIKLSDFHYDEDRKVLFVNVGDIVVEQASVDFGRTTLNTTSGPFVTRGAMTELGRKVALSAQAVAGERAREPENMNKVRGYAREALAGLFGGALRAAKLNARVEIRFPDEHVSLNSPDDQWDVTRSLQEVLGNAT